MAPAKRFRTYSRGNSSVSCVEAFDILFAKNLTQRKLNKKVHKGKNKIKLEIKELPTKIKTVLANESSLRVNINDTFDNLLKEPCKNIRSQDIRVKLIANKSSFSVIKHLSNLNVSPMLYNLRSTSKSTTKTTLNSWFDNITPSGAAITNELETEELGSSCKRGVKSNNTSKSVSSRSSPIFLRSRKLEPRLEPSGSANEICVTKSSIECEDLSKESQINQSIKCITSSRQSIYLNPVFSNNIKKQILIHSSTPIAPKNNKALMGQTFSPINKQDEVENCIVQSLEEIRSWNLTLPPFEPLDGKQDETKSKISSSGHFPTLSFNLEDFELFFEQLKEKPSTTDQFENNNSKITVQSITLEDFEKFHKEFSGKENSQEKEKRDISLKDFESFCELHYKNISLNKESFFDSCREAINFVTHRKHKLSVNPKLHQHRRLSKKFNLKNLVVVLDNNIMNFSNSKQGETQNGVNNKQLTVKLTRFSLDNLKLMLNENNSRQSRFKPKRNHSENRFKACRKFASNWSIERSPDVLQSKSINISVNASNSNRVNKPNGGFSTEASKRYSDKRAIRMQTKEEKYNKSDKENGISIKNGCKMSEESRKSCRVILSRLSSSETDLHTPPTLAKSRTDKRYLSTSQIENMNRCSSREDIGAYQTPSEIFDTSERTSRSKSRREKEYVAKILLTSTSDTSEIQEDEKSPVIVHKYPSQSTLLSTDRKLITRKSWHGYPNAKDHQNKSLSLYRSCSNSNVSYIAQDLSNTIYSNTDTPLSTSEANESISSFSLKTPNRYTKRRSASLTSMCLRSSVTRKSSLNNQSTEIKNCDNHTKNESSSCVRRLEYSLQSNDSERLDLVDESVAEVPTAITSRKKPPNLTAGKSWRRSFLQHKRESVTVPSNSYCGKLSIGSELTETPPLCTKIVPSENSIRLRRKTLLQTYVNSDVMLNDNVTTRRKLSIKKPEPIVKARDLVLQYCRQTEPAAFEEVYPTTVLKNCKKIGEGVYGEVFLYSQANGDTTVMKIIPIEGDKLVNGERQKQFHEILSEIVIVSQLSNLRNTFENKTSAYCEVRRICCVKGKYPKLLLDLWYAYDKAKGSENDAPDLFEDDQLYMVLDLANGGQDLEAFVFSNSSQAIAMFKQVAYALAVGEEHLQFEHRDLHWGNILLRSVDKNKKVMFKHRGKLKKCASQGVEVTIIDFTLSRIAHDGIVIFNDLSQDPDLFLAKGDYQFDIYRLMKDRNGNDWQKSTPYSNILWLHYILRKSFTALRYKNTKTKIHKKCIDSLKTYENNILNFNCVSDFVDECF